MLTRCLASYHLWEISCFEYNFKFAWLDILIFIHWCEHSKVSVGTFHEIFAIKPRRSMMNL